MNATRLFSAFLGVTAVTLFAGCSNGPSWGAWSKRPTDAEVAAVLARTSAPEQIAQQPLPTDASPTRVAVR